MAPHGRRIINFTDELLCKITRMRIVKGQSSGHADLSHSHWSLKNRRGKDHSPEWYVPKGSVAYATLKRSALG